MKLKSKLFLFCGLMLISILPIWADPPDAPVVPRLPGIPFDGPEPIDGTYLLGHKEDLVRQRAALLEFQPATMERNTVVTTPVAVGDEFTINLTDSAAKTNYDETFKIVLIGIHGIILVTKDAYDSFDGVNYHFVNPIGDGSQTWLRTEDLLTPDQLSYLLGEFDNTIYPKDTEVFGEPLPRGAEGQKIWILLHNIRDEAYYNPDEDTYVAGYFSASENTENDKNMMHIDTYDWINRTGPGVARPFQYEGTFAHEFEHLIHFDRDPDEPSWLDEGCADLAGFICGYGHPVRHVTYYIVLHPVTSLTFWGNGLENYGASYLFLLYLYEKYGGSAFVSDLVLEQANGIEGVETTLKNNGYRISFNTLFDNWTIANYLDNSDICGGKYGYDSIEIGSGDSGGFTIASALEIIWENPFTTAPFAISSDWYGSDPRPYTAHYYPFHNDTITKLSIAGNVFAGVLPVSGAYEWYSAWEDWAWRGISRTFEIPPTGATLSFNTYFEIEEDWDYGYVEVYDRNTGEWYTLESSATTNTLPFPQDNPNVPAEREPSAYFGNGRWHAFTGVSGSWITVNMELTPFAGHTIELYFKTWQDGASTLQMMYVDDIAIPEIGFFDDVENEQHNWTVESWTRSNGKFPNSLSALTLTIFDPPASENNEAAAASSLCQKGSGSLSWLMQKFLLIQPMKINPETQEGISFVVPAPVDDLLKHITILTNHTDHILYSHYNLEAVFLNRPCHHNILK